MLGRIICADVPRSVASRSLEGGMSRRAFLKRGGRVRPPRQHRPARALVELYAEKGDRKYERAAMKYLRRSTD
jgi:hypothetical protein